jgi:hypothetical protein
MKSHDKEAHTRTLQTSLAVALLAGICLPACAQTREPTSQQKPAAEKAQASDTKPLNERLTAAGWEALNNDKHQVAITNADKCIDEFLGAAKRIQAKLEAEKATIPTGAVSEEQKKRIFDNGVLNDVATCYFIKGRALEKSGRKEDAKKAYEAVKKLSYGRCWDPGGWFWSPAETAADRLRVLD